MSTKITLYNANDNVVNLTGVTDTTGAPITGASITGLIVDKTGTAVVGTPNPITFGDVSGSPGSYAGPVPALVATAGTYTLRVSGTHTGVTLYAEVACAIATRTL
jgi:hypothetical protein